jgi:predicted phage terminase large subunit-like protein
MTRAGERSLLDRMTGVLGAERTREVLRNTPAQDYVPMPLPPPWNKMSAWDAGPSRFADIILRPSQLIALRPPRPYRVALFRCGRNFGKNYTAAVTLNHLAQEAWGAIQTGKLSPGDATFLICGRASDDTLDAGVKGKSGIVENSPPWFPAEYLPGSRRIVWGDGTVSAIVRTAQEPLGARGLNLAFAWLDEISSWPHWAETFGAIDLAVRTGPRPRLLMTTTPSTRAPWLKDLIAAPGTIDVHRPSADNATNMPAGWLEDQYRRRTRFEIAEELEAELLDGIGGDYFPSADAQLLDRAPDDIVATCRAWDLAASTPNPGNPDPDFTAGVKLGRRASGRYVVLDAVLVRMRAGDVESLIQQMAARDGAGCRIRLNQDPGQAGKAQVEDLVRKLAGFVVVSERETGPKETRAQPFAAMWQHRNVDLVRGVWNAPYLDQMQCFPSKFAHDDAIDASSAAFNHLTGRVEPNWTGGKIGGCTRVDAGMPRRRRWSRTEEER